MVGIGHCPLIPMTGRFCIPSGFAYIHATSKSWVIVLAPARDRKTQSGNKKVDKDMVIVVTKSQLRVQLNVLNSRQKSQGSPQLSGCRNNATGRKRIRLMKLIRLIRFVSRRLKQGSDKPLSPQDARLNPSSAGISDHQIHCYI